MSEQPGGRARQSSWGLRRSGDDAGASWEGEGQQRRREPPQRGPRWRALLVVAVGLALAVAALLLA